MGNHGDDRSGGHRWRDRDNGGWQSGSGYRGSGPERGAGGDGWSEGGRDRSGWRPDRDSDDDRGFFERAGDMVRSWVGDDDGHRRHAMDERGWHHDRGVGPRDNGYYDRGETSRDWGHSDNRERDSRERDNRDHGNRDHGPGTLGGGGFGGGWNNQAADSWNQERPGRPGWFTDSVGGERGHRRGGAAGRSSDELSGSGSDHHYGARGHRSGQYEGGARRYTGFDAPAEARGGESHAQHGHDPLYSEWRRRQIEELDRDYAEYRREHQSKFESEFGGWRSKRQTQRQMLGSVSDHMEVVGADGSHVGKVDRVAGDRIILAKHDPAAGGMYHSIPCGWIETVAERVTLNRTAEEARNAWREEEGNRALFERPQAGSDGPHVLNRSFAGTYADDRGDASGAAARTERTGLGEANPTDRTGRPDRIDPQP